MRQKKNRKKKKNRKIRILAGAVLGVGLVGALFFNVFKIRNIQVAGNTRYTKDEIKEMVADDKWMINSVLLTTFHSRVDMSDIPFMNSVEFTFVSPDTICVNVNEKKVVGYVEYEGQKVYFDKNGIVLECVDEEQGTAADGAQEGSADDGSLSSEPLTSSSVSSSGSALSADTIKSARVTTADFQPSLSDVPLVTGLTFDHVTVNEQLPVEKPAVFRTMLALTRMTEKYDITPDSVEFTENSEIILHYYDTVRILLGTDTALEEKMTRVAAILPSLSGLSGELHMEDYKDGDSSFVFSKDTEDTQAQNADTQQQIDIGTGEGDAADGTDQTDVTAENTDTQNPENTQDTADQTDAENTGDTDDTQDEISYDDTQDTADENTYDDTYDDGSDESYDDYTDEESYDDTGYDEE